MAKYERGILGSFKGQVGTVVGATWKGMEIMKIKRRSSNGKPTQKQVEQQARFSFLVKFIAPLAKLLDLSFNMPGVQKTGVNNAFHYNYKNALRGVYPSFSFDYSKVLVSKGDLHPAKNPAASAVGSDLVKFTWGNNSGIAQANATDKCIMVVHCPEVNRSVYITAGATRDAESDTIDAGIFTGLSVETWLAFISEDGHEVATSVYTGQLVIS